MSTAFNCRQVFPRVEIIQFVDKAPIAVDRPGVSTISDSVQELIFECD